MKRLFLFLVACVTGWWGYLKLRSHPRTAGKVAELERQSRIMVDKATDVARSAKGQVAGKAAGMADTAATGVHQAIDEAGAKAREALDMAAETARRSTSAVQEKVTELRGEASANAAPEADSGRP